MSEPRAACAACGAEQPYGRIVCTECGRPLVFPAELKDAHRFPMRRCLKCGHAVDAADSLATPDAPPPSEGDICVCIKCAEPMIFNADLSFRWPTPEERAEILAEPDTADTIKAVRHAAYLDQRLSERACDRCGKAYQGPAVYCSFECAVADA
jgi:hypothetical protein